MQLDETITRDIIELYDKLRFVPFLKDKKQIIPDLAELLKQAMPKFEKYGIAFSGGVDSSLLALLSQNQRKNFILYSVGLENSPDIIAATKSASIMQWPIKFRILTIEEAESIIKKVADILERHNALNVVNVGVAAVEYAVLGMAEQDHQNVVIGGLGSEEIFAGYERHRHNTHEACWQGLKDIYKRDLIRDNAIFKHFNIKAHCPFLDKVLIEYAMQIHPELKINNEEKKLILRETAFFLGLPLDIAFRKKKAAQYGSNFDKVLEKLAKKNGFSFKQEYLVSLVNN